MRTLVTELLDPVPFLVLIAAWLLIAKRRSNAFRSRVRWWLCFGALFSLTALCTSWGSYWLLFPLERAFPPLREIPDGTQAIVVLGGYVKPSADPERIGELGTDTLQRCYRAAAIYRAGLKRPILVSGGAMHPNEPQHTLAEAMRRTLVDFGVASQDIWLEDQSHNTQENAEYSARILAESDIARALLITDAAHLRRAVGSFQRAAPKVEFIPCGVDYKTLENPVDSIGLWSGMKPSTNGARGSCTALHEWVGLAWYAVSSR